MPGCAGPCRPAAGLDGHPGGWLAVVLDGSATVRTAAFGAFDEALELLTQVAALAVDVPVGLTTDAPRDADLAAKRLLGRRHGTVFNTPPLPALRADSYEQANAISRRLTGVGISRQAWALRARILDVDACQPLDDAVVEVHPELAFRELAGRVLVSKKTWNGLATRLGLLRDVGIELPERVADGEVARPDDVVDAAVAAWVAAGLPHQLACVPSHPRQTAHGRPVAIWVRQAPHARTR